MVAAKGDRGGPSGVGGADSAGVGRRRRRDTSGTARHSRHDQPLDGQPCPARGILNHSLRSHDHNQHSTAQHSTAQHSTAQHSTAQHSTAQHSTAQHKSTHTRTTLSATACRSLDRASWNTRAALDSPSLAPTSSCKPMSCITTRTTGRV